MTIRAQEISLIYNGADSINWAESVPYTSYQWKISRVDGTMSLDFRDSPTAEWAACDLHEISPDDFKIVAAAIQAALQIEL